MTPRRRDVLLGVIDKKEAELLLADLVNLDPQGLSDPRFERFSHRWGKFFLGYDLQQQKDRAELYHFLTKQLRQALRAAWNAQNLREREWYAHQVREVYNENRVDRSEEGRRLLPIASRRVHSVGTETLPNDVARIAETGTARAELQRLRKALPAITPIDAALQHFGHILPRVSHCQNAACHTPYFLANKVGQMFCSGPCARPAQQEAKRRWWNNNRTKKRGK